MQNKTFGEMLSYLRRTSGLNQKQAAESLGISQALLSHYENGIREPKLEFIDRLCDYYGVTADFLLGRNDAKEDTITDIARIVSAELDEIGSEELSVACEWYISCIARGLQRAIAEPHHVFDSELNAETAAALQAVYKASGKKDGKK